MLSFFNGIFDSTKASSIAVGDFFACLCAALVLGGAISLFYKYKTHYTKSFLVTLTLLPSIVAVIIMMVNGNIGAGVAVAVGVCALVGVGVSVGVSMLVGTAVSVAVSVALPAATLAGALAACTTAMLPRTAAASMASGRMRARPDR